MYSCRCRFTHHWIGALVLIALGSSPRAFAHQGIHEQIDALTERIAAAPEDARLHLRRAELHRIHRDWQAAARDYRRARRLDPRLAAVDLGEGRMLLEAGRSGEAVTVLDRFLAQEPSNVLGHVLRARAFAAQKRFEEAVADYTLAIASSGTSGRPRPEFYLERARAQAALGGDAVGAAVKGLDDGMARLGYLSTLQSYAIDLEMSRKDFDAALARAKDATARSRRKETWLARQAEIHEKAGRLEAARKLLLEAARELAALPAHHRRSRPMKDLEMKLQAALRRVTATSAITSRTAIHPPTIRSSP